MRFEQTMQTSSVTIRHSNERGLAQSSRAAIDWIRWLLDRLRSGRGRLRVSALNDHWLRSHERESWKRGGDR
jgi:hypothetical protein